MVTYAQTGRLLQLTTPLGTDVLKLEKLQGSEMLSGLFRFELDLLADAGTTVAFEKILGQAVTAQVQMPDNSTRYVNGIVSRFSEGGQVSGSQGRITFTRFRAEVVPQLWLLTRQAQSRIFQQMAVPDIVQKVLKGITLDWQVQGTFDPRDYCVQYRETDFDFASRLMEEEGIYYYFKHANGSHTMVVGNTPQSHADVPGTTTLIYETQQGGTRPDDRILTWRKSQELRSGKQTRWDYCFEMPTKNLAATKASTASVAVGTVTHKLTVGVNDSLEVYDYPGGYAQRYDGIAPGGGDRSSDLSKIPDDGTRTVGVRMDQEAAPAVVIEGEGTCRQLTAGHKFTLDQHFDGNGAYIVTRVEHNANMEGVYTQPTGGDSAEPGYSNKFQCMPAALPYRPAQVTPRARVYGTQTAVVVGPSGQEIFTDKYSRVKVQFPWDRAGTNDENSSCWVRVGTMWAGQQWGAIHIPRIGQEVIVAFEEGDPDRPIIVGSVYNANQMPPYTLPDNATQSGIKSRSSTQGTTDNFNELRFEDKKGSEMVYFHAEKDFVREVENNDSLTVGIATPNTPNKGDQTIEIYNNQSLKVGTGAANADDGSQTIDVFNSQTVTIGSGAGNAKDGSQTISVYKNRTETVKTGDEAVTIEQGNRTVTVKTGNDTHEVKTGNRAVTVDTGNDTLTIKTGNQTTQVSLGKCSTTAMQSIELTVGGNSIKIDQTGVTITGMMVKIQGQTQTQIAGAMTQVSASAMLQLSGGVTMIG